MANQFEHLSMELIFGGLGHDVDYTRVPAVAHRIVAGLDTELLYRVWEKERLVDVGVDVVTIGAIETECGLVLARAVGRNCNCYRESLRAALVSTGGASTVPAVIS